MLPIVAYSSLVEVPAQVDGQEFYLGASVWSADAERAWRVVEGIETSTV